MDSGIVPSIDWNPDMRVSGILGVSNHLYIFCTYFISRLIQPEKVDKSCLENLSIILCPALFQTGRHCTFFELYLKERGEGFKVGSGVNLVFVIMIFAEGLNDSVAYPMFS